MALMFDFPRRRRVYQHLRASENPFLLSEFEFKKQFRLSKVCVKYIINTIRPYMSTSNRKSSISIERKVLTAIHFCAVGSYQNGIGKNAYLQISRPMVSKSLKEFTNAVVNHMAAEWIKFPTSPLDIARTKQRFLEKFGMPNTIGLVDGTHIAIVPPPKLNPLYQEHLYINRKQFHSINCQIVCDADLQIISLNAKYPGRNHDAYIWKNSSVKKYLAESNMNNTWVLADSGYPIEPWCMTPILGNFPMDSPQANYNKCHKKTRCTVERCIGVLKQRWRCLLKDRTLHYRPTKSSKIIITCAILHNIARKYNIELSSSDENDSDENVEINNDIDDEDLNNNGNILEAGRRVQETLLREHFTL